MPSAKLLEPARWNGCEDSDGLFWPQEIIGELSRAVSPMGQWQIITIHYFYKKKGKRTFSLPLSQNEFYVCKENPANRPQRLKFSINSQDSDLTEQSSTWTSSLNPPSIPQTSFRSLVAWCSSPPAQQSSAWAERSSGWGPLSIWHSLLTLPMSWWEQIRLRCGHALIRSRLVMCLIEDRIKNCLEWLLVAMKTSRTQYGPLRLVWHGHWFSHCSLKFLPHSTPPCGLNMHSVSKERSIKWNANFALNAEEKHGKTFRNQLQHWALYNSFAIPQSPFTLSLS